VTMGQLLSLTMIVAGVIGYKMLAKRGKPISLKSQ